MKKRKFQLPRWLTVDSIKKFSDPIQLFEYTIPIVGFYCGIIPKTTPKTELLVATLLIFTFFFIINLRNKYIEYEKSIAEVLETGYFSNFFKKTASHILEKKQENQPIKFTFKDGNTETVKANQIKVKVILPLSVNSLTDIIKNIENTAKSGNIDNGAWVYAKKNLNNTITIYECPRTLTTIDQYLPERYEYSEEKSKIFHKFFNNKFDEDWRKAITSIPSDIFTISNKFEE